MSIWNRSLVAVGAVLTTAVALTSVSAPAVATTTAPAGNGIGIGIGIGKPFGPVVIGEIEKAFPSEVAAYRAEVKTFREHRALARQIIAQVYRNSTIVQELRLKTKLAKATTVLQMRIAIKQYLRSTRHERQAALASLKSVDEAFTEQVKQARLALLRAIVKTRS